MKTFIISLCFILCLAVVAGRAENNSKEDETNLKISAIQDGDTTDDISIKIMIENIGTKEVTVLKEFRPLPAFFSLHLKTENGTPIRTRKTFTNISFRRNSQQYVTLRPGELVGTSILLKDKDLLPDLKPGKYTLSVVYHNQYGKDCFRGRLTSEPIEIVVTENTTPPSTEVTEEQDGE